MGREDSREFVMMCKASEVVGFGGVGQRLVGWSYWIQSRDGSALSNVKI